MPNDSTPSSFASSRKDLQDVATTAKEAVKDLKSTASVYANQAGQQIKTLADHAKSEGAVQLTQVRASLNQTAEDIRKMVLAKPVTSVLIGVAVGFALAAWCRSGSRRDET